LKFGTPNLRYIFQYCVLFLEAFLFRDNISPTDTAKLKVFMPITSVDFWNHLNNSAYLRYAELARVNWFMRTNVWEFLKKNFGYHLAFSAVTLRFRREILAFETIQIHTRVVYWDKFTLYVEQKFVNANQGGFVHCVIYGQYTLTYKGKKVTSEVLGSTTRNRGLLMVPWNREALLETNFIDTWGEHGQNQELYECDLPKPKSLDAWMEFLTESSAESKANLK